MKQTSSLSNTLYPTYDVDQSKTSVYICSIVLWLGKLYCPVVGTITLAMVNYTGL